MPSLRSLLKPFRSKAHEPDRLCSLPTEILIDILCRLDYITLTLSVPRVCRRLRSLSPHIAPRPSKTVHLHPLLSDNRLVVSRTRNLYANGRYSAIGSNCIGIIAPGGRFVSLCDTPFAKDPIVYNLPATGLFLSLRWSARSCMGRSAGLFGEQKNMLGLAVEVGNKISITDRDMKQYKMQEGASVGLFGEMMLEIQGKEMEDWVLVLYVGAGMFPYFDFS